MARKVIAEFDAIDGPFINKLRAIDRSVTRFEVGTLTAFGRVEKGMNGLLASAARLQNVSGIIAGGFGAAMAVQFVDQATRIRRALAEAGDASQEGFDKAFLASQRSLAGFEAFTQGVMRMKKATGGSFETAVRDMETLNKLLVLGGKSTQERMSTMIQFSQALQAGVLQGEELRSLRENAPIELIKAIAKEAGGGIEDLKKFGEAGVLTTEVMIRALQSLEAEADRRIKGVTMTMSEAATQFANAGIVATEGFDKGLGLSRAAVSGLTYLAEVLGSNAEAAETFGKALQIAAISGVGAFAGGKITDAIKGQQEFSKALTAAANAADKEHAAAKRSLDAAKRRIVVTTSVIDKLAMQTGNEKKLAAANVANGKAVTALTAAQARYAAAVVAVDAAQARLTFSTRVTAGAMNLLKGAMAFLGGWPGIILAAGLAFMQLRGNVESTAERFDRLREGTESATSALDAVIEVQSRLNDAIAEYGYKSDETNKRVLEGTAQELEAKRTLLALENDRLRTLQEQRQAEMFRLKQERDNIAAPSTRIDDILQKQLGDQAAFAGAEERANALVQATQEFNAEFDAVNSKVSELNAQFSLTAAQIDRNNVTLSQTGLVLAEASAKAFDLSGALETATSAANALANAGPGGGWLSAAIGGVSALIGRLSVAVGLKKALAGGATTTKGPAFEDKGRMGSGVQPVATVNPTLDDLITKNAGSVGVGGGVGGGRGVDLDKEALQLIESMMTAEERRAEKIKEAVALREKLVAKYGAEHDMVKRVDEAIERMNETMAEGRTLQEQFWGTMSDHIAESINDWKGWGNFVRSLLASFVSKYGEDFFTALFSPGKQTGDGLGTWLGNALTGDLATTKTAASVTRGKTAAFDAASLNRGLALPTQAPASGGIVISMPVDMRGADPSMIPYIDGKMAELKREFPGRVLQAVNTLKKTRKI